MADRPFIYRFTKDLRLDDHAGLGAAASRGAVLPILVLDSELETRLRISPRRAAFFCSAVRALDGELRARGSQLVIARGAVSSTIVKIARAADAAGAAWSAAYDAAGMEADRRLQSELEEQGLAAVVVHDACAIAPEESGAAHSAAGDGYRAFAPYFDVWSNLVIASHEHPLLLRFARGALTGEPLPTPQQYGAGEGGPAAGPAAAHAIFERFLREDAAQYSIAANVPFEDQTSHLSPHLSFGTISTRTIARAIRERLADPFALSEERMSLRRFLRALAHRDFFLQLSWFHPRTHDEPLQEKMRGFTWARSHPQLDAWRAGRTGYPLVDAGLRQLQRTGWMHPHVRAVAASVLCFDFGVDWRIGRDDWNRLLIEDDPAIATGNWQWIAGVGADMAQYPRIYNPERQRRRYDPEGRYVRRWVGELEDVPVETWYGRAVNSPQLALSLFAHDGYPQPYVDHDVAARAFLRRYRAFVSP
jgi:deoxyribodipyrimidine photo-lyase